MVAQLPLEEFVMVRIHAGQPFPIPPFPPLPWKVAGPEKEGSIDRT